MDKTKTTVIWQEMDLRMKFDTPLFMYFVFSLLITFKENSFYCFHKLTWKPAYKTKTVQTET